VNEPAIGGADFLVALQTDETENLATYCFRVFYNSDQVRFIPGIYQSGLPSGFGKQPGLAIVDSTHWDDGVGSYLDITSAGIGGYSGQQVLIMFAFEALATGVNGEVRAEDCPRSSIPYGNSILEPLPHALEAEPVSYTVPGPYTGPLSTRTPIPTRTPPPTCTPAPPRLSATLVDAVSGLPAWFLYQENDLELAPGCIADFFVDIHSSDTTGLNTYKQRVLYPPADVQYSGCAEIALPGGFGKSPGTIIVDDLRAPEGFLDIHGRAISGQTGPETLVRLAFSALSADAEGTIEVIDNPETSPSYADATGQDIPHSHSAPVRFHTFAGVAPTAPPPSMDRDGDAIPDELESGMVAMAGESNGYLPDSDGDGLSDGMEDQNRDGDRDAGELNARDRDSDNDGYIDGIEISILETDPLDPGDPGLAYVDDDQDELPLELDPDDTNPDTDGDRYLDGYEAATLGLCAVADAQIVPRLGDCHPDGQIDNSEPQMILNFFARLPMAEFDPVVADVRRDGIIDKGDAQYLEIYFMRDADYLPHISPKR
jgi:hypothetical protein